MLSPKNVKFRKQFRGRTKGSPTRGNTLSFGDFGLQAVECGYINARQIEAARVAMTRKAKRQGKSWIRFFPDHPITKKPAEVRMGKGKGATDAWVARVKPGKILYEKIMLKASEIRDMDAGQIKDKIFELKKELFNLRFQNNVGQLPNTANLSSVRKNIARLYTISKEMNIKIS